MTGKLIQREKAYLPCSRIPNNPCRCPALKEEESNILKLCAPCIPLLPKSTVWKGNQENLLTNTASTKVSRSPSTVINRLLVFNFDMM